MGLKSILLALAHFVVVLAVSSACTGHEGAPSHSPVPTPLPAVSVGAQCSDIIYNMMDCVPYLSSGSSLVEPKSACCSGAKSVLDVNGECICVAIEKSSALGIQLNMTRVQGLPLVCGIGEYPLENCGSTYFFSDYKHTLLSKVIVCLLHMLSSLEMTFFFSPP